MHRYTQIRTQGHTCTHPSQAGSPAQHGPGQEQPQSVSPLRGLFVLSSRELALLSESQSLHTEVPRSLCFLPDTFQARLLHIIGLR